MIGWLCVLAWVIAPLAYYTDLWGFKGHADCLVIVFFTADGYFYNVTAVLDSRLRLNETAYKNYGMLLSDMFEFYGV